MALRSETLQRPWGRLALWTAGLGQPVIAVHGLGGSGRYWQGLAAHIADRFALVAPDLGGFGHSDKPSLAYDRAFHLANLDEVVDGVAGTQRVVLVGHSLGGVLAALWAAEHPERVAALVLVASPFPASGRTPPGERHRNLSARRRRLRRVVEASIRALWPVVVAVVPSRLFPRAVVADYVRSTRESYIGTLRSLYWDEQLISAVRGLGSLRSPALVLTAPDDRRVDAEDAKRWAALLPNAVVRTVTGGHHLLLRTGFGVLVDFLDDVAAQVESAD